MPVQKGIGAYTKLNFGRIHLQQTNVMSSNTHLKWNVKLIQHDVIPKKKLKLQIESAHAEMLVSLKLCWILI